MTKNIPIACDLTVFPLPVRNQLPGSISEMFHSVQEVHELIDGYAFQFANEPGKWLALADFIEHERQCCPFYHFALEAEPNGGPFWLKMTGGEGVKEFVETVWRDLPGAVAMNLIRIGPDDDLDEIVTQAAPIFAETVTKAIPMPKDEV